MSPNVIVVRYFDVFRKDSFVDLAVETMTDIVRTLCFTNETVFQISRKKPVKISNSSELKECVSFYINEVLCSNALQSYFITPIPKGRKFAFLMSRLVPCQVPTMQIYLRMSAEAAKAFREEVINLYINTNRIDLYHERSVGLFLAKPISFFLFQNLQIDRLKSKDREGFKLHDGYRSVLYAETERLFNECGIESKGIVSLANKKECSRYNREIKESIIKKVGKTEYRRLLKELDSVSRFEPPAWRQ